jgi:hypothetical protein
MGTLPYTLSQLRCYIVVVSLTSCQPAKLGSRRGRKGSSRREKCKSHRYVDLLSVTPLRGEQSLHFKAYRLGNKESTAGWQGLNEPGLEIEHLSGGPPRTASDT